MGIFIGISEDIGWREKMEDEHAIYQIQDKGFFSAEVYDGHGGRQAAHIAAEMLTPYFLHLWSKESEKDPSEQLEIYELLRQACLMVDSHITERGIKSGTTLANFYIIKERFIAMGIGDSRVVIGVKNSARALTEDHKPDHPYERARIEAAGGRVIRVGVPRVQGELAMSRAIGDVHLKPYVIAEPLIVEGFLGIENDYVVLACDGVWDVLTEDDVIDIVRGVADPQNAAEKIKASAIDLGSTDNITVIVLDIRDYKERENHKGMEIIKRIDMAVDRHYLL